MRLAATFMFVMLGVKAANRPTALLSEFIYAPSAAKRSHDIWSALLPSSRTTLGSLDSRPTLNCNHRRGGDGDEGSLLLRPVSLAHSRRQ